MGTNTGIGIGIGIPFRNNALGGDNIYFPPELKARMIGVWDNYGKKNTDADRNIIKNKIPNAGGDLEILNAAYEGMSGCNGYPVVFGANETWENLSNVYSYTSDVTSTTIHISRVKNAGTGLLFSYVKKDGALTNIREIPAFRVTVKGLEGNSKFGYRYLATEDATVETLVYLGNGTHELSKSFAPTEALLDLTRNAWVGIFITPMVEGEVVFDCDITIEVLPEYEGAFVTDGVNDMIISQKTIAEMGITDEVTIVSMIHQITLNSTYNLATTNYIENSTTKEHVRTDVYAAGKTGIYGYTASLINSIRSTIGYILGDIRDYQAVGTTNKQTILDSKFSVVGRVGGFAELSSVAHYWTFAVLGKATEDEINLIIAKYNLDRTLRPDILCNIERQGITNDNHADFNDKLVDYSGNGRDIQMYNLAWKGDSGVAAKKFETIKDYLIVPDEGLQELTIYNEFSYKVKSIKYADRYWTIQTLNKTDVSYPITIVSDKNIIWRNAINYTDENGVKRSIRKETNVPANTPTQVFVLGFNDFDVPDNYTEVNCVAYATRTDITEFTITFIPSCKGGILLDGIEDFGKVTGMPIYKDYTVIAKYQRLSYREGIETEGGAVIASKSYSRNQGAFIFNGVKGGYAHDCYSFGLSSSNNLINDKNLEVYYQTKYTNQGKSISSGTAADSDILWLGTVRDNDNRFINAAIYSLMSFPYSMSEFLIERQLKKHKLGTLYPDMVEFRPVIKANANYNIFYTALLPLTGIVWEKINIGDYIPVGRRVAIQLSFDNEASELVSAISSQLGNISITKNSNNKGYTIFGDILKNKSPQKINITIDEYIRYEDIVQPYPSFVKLENLDRTHTYTWGDKLKVGDIIRYNSSKNLLEGAYTLRGQMECNGVYVFDNNQQIVVTKEMVFAWSHSPIWNIDDNEPKCILSPRLLRIPNSSYKILGYIPDISGHGNHGVIHNSAYAKGSGVNEDGSYQFDGVDDFVTIPTLSSGGKQVLMKVNWNTLNSVLYDQRNGIEVLFCIETGSGTIAYNHRNVGGNTFIDGILNNHILTDDLQAITHNIVLNNDYNVTNSNLFIGTNYIKSIYTKMALYDFMLFDDISTDDKIKELNEYVGIEAKVEKMPYYWDAYGKTNLDVDRGIVPQLGIAKDYSFASFDNEMAWYLIPNDNYINVVSRNGYEITLKNLSTGVNGWRFQNSTVKGFISHDIPFRIKANKSIRVYWDMHSYKVSTGAEFGEVISITNVSPNKDTYINLRHLTEEELAKLDTNKDRMYYLLWFDLSTIAVNEEVVIEMLPVEGGRNLWLNNYNFAYDKMSGFGGYSLGRFDKSWVSSSSNNTSVIVVQRNPYDITLKKLGGNSDWEFNNTELKVISNPVSVKFKSNKNIRVTCDYHYYPVGGNSEGTPLRITSKDLIANKDAIITISPISQENIDKYNIDVNRGYYLIYFQLSSTLAVNEEVTIEMLPLYPNGLVYDGVTDYSENANIPMFDDFTFLVKASLPNGFTGSGGAIAKKGSNTQVISGGYDFVYALDSNANEANKNSYWSFGKALLVSTGAIDPPLIGYMTKTNVNGIPTTAGTNPSIEGITFSRWSGYISMIFYKAILYPKTIPLLQINFLKNLMERDEIIDLDNPIFKK